MSGLNAVRVLVTRLAGVTLCHKYVTFFYCINLILHCVQALSLPMRYEKVDCNHNSHATARTATGEHALQSISSLSLSCANSPRSSASRSPSNSLRSLQAVAVGNSSSTSSASRRASTLLPKHSDRGNHEGTITATLAWTHIHSSVCRITVTNTLVLEEIHIEIHKVTGKANVQVGMRKIVKGKRAWGWGTHLVFHMMLPASPQSEFILK
jgi:hypothetical protein